MSSDVSLEPLLIGVASMLLSLAIVFVAIRLFVRKFSTSTIGIDDYVTLAALAFTVIDGIIMCYMTTTGLGEHEHNLNPQQMERYLLLFYLALVFYYVALGNIKVAILFLYLRIFPHTSKTHKVTKVVLILVALWSGIILLIQVFTCDPVQGFWQEGITESCIPELPLWYINAAGNIISNVVIYVLPMPALWETQLPRRQKMSLLIVFALGFFPLVVSFLRIDFLNLKDDATYNYVRTSLFSLGELCVGLIASSLPALRPLFFDTPASRRTRRNPTVVARAAFIAGHQSTALRPMSRSRWSNVARSATNDYPSVPSLGQARNYGSSGSVSEPSSSQELLSFMRITDDVEMQPVFGAADRGARGPLG